jgi:hypothetical protein
MRFLSAIRGFWRFSRKHTLETGCALAQRANKRLFRASIRGGTHSEVRSIGKEIANRPFWRRIDFVQSTRRGIDRAGSHENIRRCLPVLPGFL